MDNVLALGNDNGHDELFRVPRYVAPKPRELNYEALVDLAAAGEVYGYDEAA